MHSGKKPQSILVKSDDFENSFSLLYILLKSCLCCCSLATLAPQQLVISTFSLEALTLTFYANLSVFFLLVHDVSVTEKQMICVQSRVLNLYGVYLGNFSLLVV